METNKLLQNILEHKVIPTHKCFESLLDAIYTYTNTYDGAYLNYKRCYIQLIQFFVDHMLESGLTLDLLDVKK